MNYAKKKWRELVGVNSYRVVRENIVSKITNLTGTDNHDVMIALWDTNPVIKLELNNDGEKTNQAELPASKRTTALFDYLFNNLKKLNIMIKYYKHPSRELEEQTFARLTFTEGQDNYKDTEMLIAGYVGGTPLSNGIRKLDFNNQNLLSDFEYMNIWQKIIGFLTEISQEEFIANYNQYCIFLLK